MQGDRMYSRHTQAGTIPDKVNLRLRATRSGYMSRRCRSEWVGTARKEEMRGGW